MTAQDDVHGELVDDWHRAAWMQTFTGRAFRPWHAGPDDIDPRDIARSLSMQCRYNGHVSRFYSVAEHAVLMTQWFYEQGDRESALWALLHDAAEAYIGDMVRPLKITDEMQAYRELDDTLTGLIAFRFGANGLSMPDAVRAADNRILLDERAVLLGAPAQPWHQDTDGTQPLGVTIAGFDPYTAEDRWLGWLEELTP